MVLPLLLALAQTPTVTMLSTSPEQGITRLRMQRIGQPLVEPVCHFNHLPGATVHGVLVPGTQLVAATAQVTPNRDASFAGALFVLEAGKESRQVADAVVVPSAPLAMRPGKVVVQRGVAGASEHRIDGLWLEEFDVSSGAGRVIYRDQAFLTLPIALLGNELLVYVVGPEGARIDAVELNHLSVRRVLETMEPMARDFTLDVTGGRLYFTQADRANQGWQVIRLDLYRGTQRTVARSESMALLPTLFPDGAVGISPGPGGGLIEALSRRTLLEARGTGYERVRAFSKGLALGEHEVAGHFITPFAVDLNTGRSLPLSFSQRANHRIVGVSP